MSKWSKLYQQLLVSRSRSVSFRDFEALLRAFGFVHERTTGSHRHFTHPRIAWTFTIQPRGKDAVRYQVKRLLELVREYDLHMQL